jgi:hypothetical protein
MTALQGLSARSGGRRDAGTSQGPRDDARRACKAAPGLGEMGVAFRGLRRASAPLADPSSAAAALPLRRVDVSHRRRAASYPEAAKSRSYVSSSYDRGY